MKEIILIKDGEIALKGLNRAQFEDRLIKNMRRKLEPIGKFKFYKAQSTLYAEPLEENIDLEEAFDQLKKVFGIAALSKACVVEKDFEQIKQATVEYLKEELTDAFTFKVEAKRSDKAFPLNSPAICMQLGEHLLNTFPNLSVDVHQPDLIVTVEIRDYAAYIHLQQQPGAGGMPVGTSGKATLLISGGIDSPVAGYMMAKRGLELAAVHFASPPYTSERAKLKVMQLLEKVSEYSGRIKLYVVPFTEIQEAIRDHCPDNLFTLIMRRFMMRIAQKISENIFSGALITGETVGQVASQTLSAIQCTDAVCQMPVFRPLVGMDKEETIRLSRMIDTFEISIQPYEDCCTVFTPKHPKTKPTIEMVEKAESIVDWQPMIDRAIENIEIITIKP